MQIFRPPAEFVISETEHWTINHRVDSRLPGYLMVGSRADTNNLAVLSPAALAELGGHLSRIQQALIDLFSPPHFYVGRYGHMTGHSIHFHVIPVYEWVAQAFLRDDRYRALHQFYTAGVYDTDAAFDGAEMTLFIWREFCESSTPPPIIGPSVPEVVALLRSRLQ